MVTPDKWLWPCVSVTFGNDSSEMNLEEVPDKGHQRARNRGKGEESTGIVATEFQNGNALDLSEMRFAGACTTWWSGILRYESPIKVPFGSCPDPSAHRFPNRMGIACMACGADGSLLAGISATSERMS